MLDNSYPTKEIMTHFLNSKLCYIVILDEQYKIVEHNKLIENVFKEAEESFNQKDFFSFFSEADWSLMETKLQKALIQKIDPFEIKIIICGLKWLKLEVSVLRNQNGRYYFLISGFDITHLKLKIPSQASLNITKNEIDLIDKPICIIDQKLNILNANSSFKKLFNFIDLVPTHNLKDFIPSNLERDINKNLLSNEPYSIYYFDKEYDSNFKVIMECSDGEYKMIFEKLNQYESLKRKANFFDSALKKIPHGIAYTNKKGEIIWANDQFKSLSTFTKKELNGERIGSIIQGKHENSKTAEHLHKEIDKGKSFKFEILHQQKNKQNQWCTLYCETLKNTSGEIEGFLVIHPNNHLQLLEKKEPSELTKKFKAIFDNVVTPLIIIDNNRQFINVNPAVSKLLGFSTQELLTYQLTDLIDKKNKAEAIWQKLLKAGEFEGELLLNCKSEGNKNIYLNAIANVLDGIHLFVLTDITEIKRHEHELILKNEKLERINVEKNQLFSIVSHDLRAPLSRILGLLDLLSTSALSKEEFMHIINALSRDVHETSGLLNNLLYWSIAQLEGIKVKPVKSDLYEMVKFQFDFHHIRAVEGKIKLINLLKPTTIIYADRDMIDLVLRNLVSNAIKFCPENSEITVSVKEKDSFYIVCVADSGIGISKENQLKIMKNRFSTTGVHKEKGSGLGLRLCNDFIQKNGGNIWLESELGKGSRFYFTLKKGRV